MIIDAPGHVEFVKNMITGASQAEAAVLIIDVAEGVREQTRRHSYMLSLLGLNQVVVVLNKMDLVDYDKGVFNKVKEETTRLLSSMGYPEVMFIPVSAIEGDNIYKSSERTEWYRGPILIQALDEIEPEEIGDMPLRFVVQDVYQVDSEKVVVGRVESGVLKTRDKLVINLQW